MNKLRLAMMLLVLGCEDPEFAPALTVEFPDEDTEGVVPQDSAGRILLRVRACAPDITSARATVTSLRELGDGGPATRTIVLLTPTIALQDCAVGALSSEIRLPVAASGGDIELEVATLGERQVVRRVAGPATAGAVGSITFSQPSLPEGGGLVTITVSAPASPDGAPVQLRTVPVVQLSSSSPTVRAGVAEVVMSVPDDVAGVWVEAKLGSSSTEATIERAAP